ncbi:MAG: GspJ family type II secretion system protein [Bdellovibrionales bacterium]|nr:GspJ family type II secretion system protein [Bdellovibrionales bacterium]
MPNNFATRRHLQKGFSLVEILIVMVIMATMATISANAIRSAKMNKEKIDARLKTESMVFDALKIMATDVEKAFHYQQPLYELDRLAMTTPQPGSAPGQPGAPVPQQQPQFNPQNPNQGLPPKQIKFTQFIGKESSVHFTTINNQRITANAQESNLIEVGYFLSSCKARSTGKPSQQCLWRRSSIVLDNDVTRGGTSMPMIENVSKFQLEYLSQDFEDKEWKKSWASDQSGTGNTQNRFPYMVKISIEVEDKESKALAKFGQTIIANVRFPNNTDPATFFGGQPAQGAPGASGVPGAQ